MSIEISAVSSALGAAAQPPGTTGPSPLAARTYDVALFQQAYTQASIAASPAAATAPATAAAPSGFDTVLNVFQNVDVRMREMADTAFGVNLENADLTPGQILEMTVQCHQFMFTCELTSNVANRTSDGVQQLFRQQT
jgi:hypothetical protein